MIIAGALYQGNDLRYYLTLGNTSNSGYDKEGHVAMQITNIVEAKEDNTYNFTIWPSKSVTIHNAYIRAIKIK